MFYYLKNDFDKNKYFNKNFVFNIKLKRSSSELKIDYLIIIYIIRNIRFIFNKYIYNIFIFNNNLEYINRGKLVIEN